MPNRGEFLRRLRAAPSNAPGLRAERKKISAEVAALDRTAVLGLAHDLIGAGIARFAAYELVLNHRPTFTSINQSEVEKLGEGMSCWADIDSFGCLIGGQAWRAGNIADNAVRAWARSRDWCWCRAAQVSTVPLNSRVQGGCGDAERTLDVAAILAGDRRDLVVKALSWALRELAKRDPESVRRFLSVHRDRLAARAVREVGNKLATGLKNPRRLV